MKEVFGRLLLVCLTILLYSCADDSCTAGLIETKSLSELGCTNNLSELSVNTTKEYELIRNALDYDHIIEGSCKPLILWSEYDLIAGNYQLTGTLDYIERKLQMNCSSNSLVLSIVFHIVESQEQTQLSFEALIPKIRDSQDFYVEFLVE